MAAERVFASGLRFRDVTARRATYGRPCPRCDDHEAAHIHSVALSAGGNPAWPGTAEWRYQRDEAEFITANVLGVIDVENNIDILCPIPDAGDVHHSIKKALERDAKLDADNIVVSSSHGTATLTGNVRSWSERDAAIEPAWSAHQRY